MFNRCYIKTKNIKHLNGRYNIARLGPIQLKRLRQDIILNSVYLKDYENRYNLSTYEVFKLFDGYADFLAEEMKNNIPEYKDNDFFNHLADYDTIQYLWEYYYFYFAPALQGV